MSLIQKMRDKRAAKRAARELALPGVMFWVRAKSATPAAMEAHIKEYIAAGGEKERNELLGKLFREYGPVIYIGYSTEEHPTDLRGPDGKPSSFRPIMPGDTIFTREQMRQFKTASGAMVAV